MYCTSNMQSRKLGFCSHFCTLSFLRRAKSCANMHWEVDGSTRPDSRLCSARLEESTDIRARGTVRDPSNTHALFKVTDGCTLPRAQDIEMACSMTKSCSLSTLCECKRTAKTHDKATNLGLGEHQVAPAPEQVPQQPLVPRTARAHDGHGCTQQPVRELKERESQAEDHNATQLGMRTPQEDMQQVREGRLCGLVPLKRRGGQGKHRYALSVGHRRCPSDQVHVLRCRHLYVQAVRVREERHPERGTG